MNVPPEFLEMSDEVAAALARGGPVVALESTIVTHGLPWPENLEMARAVEAEIRAAGATPATIAVIDGRLRVGLDDPALKMLARSPGAWKLSRADLAIALIRGATGGTTVAATMIAAHLAGIEVFATGGIGGVHRGAESSFDVSADLHELARTPVTVVASGAKAILDIPKTLEVLETLGVPVIAFGQDSFPAFWSATSPWPAPMRLDSAREIAVAHRARRALGISGGQLVANPVPPGHGIAWDEIAPVIEKAVAEAAERGIAGKEVTPFLLARLVELTEGRSLKANVALVRANARLAADIARALAENPTH